MQKSSSIALGALSLVVIGVLITAGGARHTPQPQPATSISSSITPPPLASWAPISSPTFSVSPLSLLDKLPPTPKPLSSSAPRAVRLGIVLIHHCQAQFAPDNCRSRDDAFAMATSLAELATKDFKDAVRRGDPGSTEDAGEIAQNILEPAPEAEVFSLAVGAVSGPIDTPRGFWVVKRLK